MTFPEPNQLNFPDVPVIKAFNNTSLNRKSEVNPITANLVLKKEPENKYKEEGIKKIYQRGSLEKNKQKLNKKPKPLFNSTIIRKTNLDSVTLQNLSNKKLSTSYTEKKSSNSSKKFYTSYSKLSEVKLITIGLASPQRIKQWAEKTLPNGKIFGEVINANTLHHKTFKPQKGGLFCERIFGPLKDFECACGKNQKFKKENKLELLKKKNTNNNSIAEINKMSENTLTSGLNSNPSLKNVLNINQSIMGCFATSGKTSTNRTRSSSFEVSSKSLISSTNLDSNSSSVIDSKSKNFCPVCDVEYTWSVMRRYQLGYINLASPVTHVWYLKGNPSYLSILLDMKKRHLEYIVYCSETLTLENIIKGGIISSKSSDIVSSWKKLKTKIMSQRSSLQKEKKIENIPQKSINSRILPNRSGINFREELLNNVIAKKIEKRKNLKLKKLNYLQHFLTLDESFSANEILSEVAIGASSLLSEENFDFKNVSANSISSKLELKTNHKTELYNFFINSQIQFKICPTEKELNLALKYYSQRLLNNKFEKKSYRLSSQDFGMPNCFFKNIKYLGFLITKTKQEKLILSDLIQTDTLNPNRKGKIPWGTLNSFLKKISIPAYILLNLNIRKKPQNLFNNIMGLSLPTDLQRKSNMISSNESNFILEPNSSLKNFSKNTNLLLETYKKALIRANKIFKKFDCFSLISSHNFIQKQSPILKNFHYNNGYLYNKTPFSQKFTTNGKTKNKLYTQKSLVSSEQQNKTLIQDLKLIINKLHNLPIDFNNKEYSSLNKIPKKIIKRFEQILKTKTTELYTLSNFSNSIENFILSFYLSNFMKGSYNNLLKKITYYDKKLNIEDSKIINTFSAPVGCFANAREDKSKFLIKIVKKKLTSLFLKLFLKGAYAALIPLTPLRGSIDASRRQLEVFDLHTGAGVSPLHRKAAPYHKQVGGGKTLSNHSLLYRLKPKGSLTDGGVLKDIPLPDGLLRKRSGGVVKDDLFKFAHKKKFKKFKKDLINFYLLINFKFNSSLFEKDTFKSEFEKILSKDFHEVKFLNRKFNNSLSSIYKLEYPEDIKIAQNFKIWNILMSSLPHQITKNTFFSFPIEPLWISHTNNSLLYDKDSIISLIASSDINKSGLVLLTPQSGSGEELRPPTLRDVGGGASPHLLESQIAHAYTGSGIKSPLLKDHYRDQTPWAPFKTSESTGVSPQRGVRGEVTETINKKLYNNVYCLSHRERWEVENDWNFLYYYITVQNKFDSNTSLNINNTLNSNELSYLTNISTVADSRRYDATTILQYSTPGSKFNFTLALAKQTAVSGATPHSAQGGIRNGVKDIYHRALTPLRGSTDASRRQLEVFDLHTGEGASPLQRKASPYPVRSFANAREAYSKIIPNYKNRFEYTLDKSNIFSEIFADEDKQYSSNFLKKPVSIFKDSNSNLNNFNTLSKENKEFFANQGTSFSGPGIIQLLLTEFNFFEIKKMDKQNRILLYQLNKLILKLKTRVLIPTHSYLAVDRLSKKELKEAYKKRDLLIRRTKLVRKLFIKESPPQSTILTVLPVLPPDLRPIVKIGGQIAASDLNRLYQRVIYRNDRLKKFLKDPATSHSYEMKYAQRLLQEAVDNLIQNGKSGVVTEKDSRGRALKSLSDILKGKQGRFRQYLLGKRVDYSGRSVIVVGPKLKLHECGLPKEMALELYLPFLLKRILNDNLSRTIVGAKLLIKTNPSLVWELLREIMQTCPVLLNRAPTLHRLGIQAFQPKLIDGRAILLHPLVCSAFNADFDGDQMAVHVPITIEARAEAWKLMLSRNSILAPSTGDPLAIPSQDMVLGCYYLTTTLMPSKNTATIFNPTQRLGNGFYFSKIEYALKAYELKKIDLHANIWLKFNPLTNSSNFIENGLDQEEPFEIRLDSFGHWNEIYSKSQKRYDFKNICLVHYILTTPGRILFNLAIQKALK